MDSSIGRFTSKDPVFYLNLYRYVKNNPMKYNDRFGRSGENNDDSCDTIKDTINKLQKSRIKVERSYKQGKITEEQYNKLINSIDAILKKEVEKYNDECKSNKAFDPYATNKELIIQDPTISNISSAISFLGGLVFIGNPGGSVIIWAASGYLWFVSFEGKIHYFRGEPPINKIVRISPWDGQPIWN